ncbi:MAG: hypothetical protein KJS92_10105, partial [Bacteroidetes bacterium]|nr:hypothetical protein [Bacteroidota bacterium]
VLQPDVVKISEEINNHRMGLNLLRWNMVQESELHGTLPVLLSGAGFFHTPTAELGLQTYVISSAPSPWYLSFWN